MTTEIVYDISRPISSKTAVWPGDAPFASEKTLCMERGDSVNVAAIRMSVHTATHADAPLHFLAEGDSIDRVELEKFIGPAWVVDLGDVRAISLDHLVGLDLRENERILFKTSSSASTGERWLESFAFLTTEAAEHLGAAGVVLVGIDTPSVDPADSSALEAHKILLQHGAVILENLMLNGVEAGRYELIALPLKLVGLDASPVRAILRGIGNENAADRVL